MADRKSLGIIGFIMSAVTATVVLVGIFVVQGHLTGRQSPPCRSEQANPTMT